MADINGEVKVTEGVFGGISMGDNGVNVAGTCANTIGNSPFETISNAGCNLPAKTGFWSKVKSVLFYDIKVELTPYQQKVEDEINEFFHQEITWSRIKELFFKK